ncbi:MAG TPA: asparaginase [Sphingomicrobium sp.]|nr:asparaginase [Sphingomicrobium sp.]
MTRRLPLIAALALGFPCHAAAAQVQQVSPVKTVRVLATGGTIAGSGQSSSAAYRAGVVPIADMLHAVPGLSNIANISSEQVTNVGSYDMDETLWLKLLARVQAAVSDPTISGVVITHGTDTLEETAYFLKLVVPSTKPVVLVGSMRPGTTVGADGPQNLLDAVRVASADEARNRGVLVVMNDTIFDPASMTKVDVRHVNAFGAPSRGPIGQVLTGRPTFFTKADPHRAAFEIAVPDARFPRVAIAYAYVGITGGDILAVARGNSGLVIAGEGAGSFSASARKAVRELTSKGFPVVRVARQGIGDVWINEPSMGDVSDASLGTVAGRELTPAKARILLMLALLRPISHDDLQSLFDRFGAAAGGE